MSGLRIAMIGLRGVPASYGGVERHVEELGSRLAERGHDVTVFCRKGYVEDELPDYRGMRLRHLSTPDSKHLDTIVHSMSAAASVVGKGYDVVHFHAVGPGLASPLPRVLTRSAVVQTIHGLDAERDKWNRGARTILRTGTWMSAHLPHATITVSRALRTHYRATYGTDAVYVPNGVVPGPAGSADVLRERFGLTPGSYVLAVGRLVPEKAAHLLVEAFRGLPDPDLRLVIAGGTSHTNDYVATVEGAVDGDPRVLMAGYVYGDDLAALYAHARVFVQPSLVEGLPLTLLEAISYGRPVVASSIPPHVEVLGADVPGGRLCEPGDVGSLQAALTRSLSQTEVELAGARVLRNAVLAHYDWDIAAEQTEAVYRSVVRPVRRPRLVAQRPAPAAETAVTEAGVVPPPRPAPVEEAEPDLR